MFKIVLIISDPEEKNKIKDYLNRAKEEIDDLDFELIKEFSSNRKAVKYLYQNSEVDVLIVENSTGKIFSGLDLIMLTEKEFSKTSVLLLTEPNKVLNYQFAALDTLTVILEKKPEYTNFINNLMLLLLKKNQRREKSKEEAEKLKDYRTIIDHTHDAIFLLRVDTEGKFYYKRINKTHQRLTALTNEEIKGKTPAEIFGEKRAVELEKNYRRCLKKKTPINYTEKLEFPSGRKSWQTSLYPVVRQGRVEEIVGASYDITALESQQKYLEYIKRYDSLTGLYNKDYFHKIYNQIYQQEELALILINVVNFNFINSFFGYQRGNQFLKDIGLILKQIADPEILNFHLFDDHFAVILKNKSKKELEKILKKLRAEFSNLSRDQIQADITVTSCLKKNKNLKARDLFNDGVSKKKLHKFKKTTNSPFYASVIKYLARENYRGRDQLQKLIKIIDQTAPYFKLSPKDKERLTALAENYDLGKLAVAKNILKKGDQLDLDEWEEYKKYTMISTSFASSYHDLAGILDLIYYQQENYDGSGWPEAKSKEEIPYLSRLFAVVNFYSSLKNNQFFIFSRKQYYFAALKKEEIINELNHYKGSKFDPQIVDKFINYLNSQN